MARSFWRQVRSRLRWLGLQRQGGDARNERSVHLAFWTSDRFKAEREAIVRPFDEGRVEDCSYELSLGTEGFVTGEGSTQKTFLDRDGAQLTIPPGQFALLLTREVVEIPPDAIGFISIKSRFKLHGLVNVSGFHVDPGFRGQLIFSVYNAGGNNIVVSRGRPLFLLWLSSLEEVTSDVYDGDRMDQDSIPDQDIMGLGLSPFSPAAVNQRLATVQADLQATRTLLNTVIGGLIVTVLGGIIVLIVAQALNDPEGQQLPAPAPTVTVTETVAPLPGSVDGKGN